MKHKVDEIKFYQSLNYEQMELDSRGGIGDAFRTFVVFVRKLSEDTFPNLFEGAVQALRAANGMAENILAAAENGKYGMMTDREASACLKVHEVSVALGQFLEAIAKYGDSTDDEEHILEVTPIQDALRASSRQLRIMALPLLER